ncbi:hypothetical protein [Leptospira levettii]|uniref:hypothetical protein n=1 Tax=Leptospira levettii TaxID=2023178 RepID=UPI00142E4A3C|nr:hypothetical protein [Leptospira levettii]
MKSQILLLNPNPLFTDIFIQSPNVTKESTKTIQEEKTKIIPSERSTIRRKEAKKN